MTRATARAGFDERTNRTHATVTTFCGVLAFAGVLFWKWDRPTDAARAPAGGAGAQQRVPMRHDSSPHEPMQAPRVQLNAQEGHAPSVPEHSQKSITTAAVPAADVAAASIAPVVDEAGETVGWQVVRGAGALSQGAVIVAINGRGISVGGRNELVAALENQQPVRVTLDATHPGDSTSASEIAVRDQLATDSVTAPPPDCRLDPEKFRSADDYRRAVYRLSLPQNAGMCMPPPE